MRRLRNRSVRSAGTAALAGLVMFLGLAGPLSAETDVRNFESLARRGFLGVDLARTENGLPVITGLHPKGGAARANVKPGDVILAVNGHDVDFGLSLGEALQPLRAGSDLVLTLRRGEETFDTDVTLRPLGFEKSEEWEIIYDAVPNGDTYLRCLVTHPSVGSDFPAVLFIQGLGCNSVEEPVEDPSTVLDFLHQLTLRGFATMRVEKSGVGDSQGESCFEIGFDDEVRGFANALRKLRTYDFVDTSNVFVFGHSMGGVMAPIVANDAPIRGVIVYGTAVTPWPEYLASNSLRQAKLSGTDPATIEDRIAEQTRFQRLLLQDGLSISEIVEQHPDLELIAESEYPDGAHAFTRSIRFFRELTAVDIAAAWSHVNVPVLAMHGEFDYATTDEEHEMIAAAVNATHPGNGSWMQIPKTFNAFNLRHSMEEALQEPWAGPLSQDVVDETIHFMRGHMQESGDRASTNE